MIKYGVYVPIIGYVYKEVEAESKQDAIDKIFEEGYEKDDIMGTEFCDNITDDKVNGISTTEVYVEEI